MRLHPPNMLLRPLTSHQFRHVRLKFTCTLDCDTDTNLFCTGKPNCSGTIRFEVKSVDATKSPSYVENMEVESAQQCAKLCHDRSDCNSAGFIPSKSSDSSKGECIFSVGVTPNCSALAESTTFYNGSTTVTLDCFACDLTGENSFIHL